MEKDYGLRSLGRQMKEPWWKGRKMEAKHQEPGRTEENGIVIERNGGFVQAFGQD
jgi:hypothetical protein